MLPNSAPTRTITPGAEDKLPRQSTLELGFGIASAQVNSEAYLSFERSVAQAAPGGLAVQGASPQGPGALAQTAPPDNPQPKRNGLALPDNPLVRGSALQGQVHARWDEKLGPCVGTISDASTEVASLSLVNAIPTLPDVADLTGVLDSPRLDAPTDQAIIDGLKQLAGPLSTLGGVLSGDAAPRPDGSGSLVSLPHTLSARSTVQLVDIPGSENKAVRTTSTLRVTALTLLAGTPFEIQVRVVSQPTLQVTSTGDATTSSIEYTAPVLEVWQGGRPLGGLDAAHPTLDIPIGIPLTGVPGAEKLPIIGDVLGNGQKVSDALTGGLRKLDLGVLRLGVAQLDEKSSPMTDPFKGFQLGATARMLDLQVLPTAALGLPNLPSALVQVSLGEQIARAYAPAGGVVCRASAQPAPPPPPSPEPQGRAPQGLAYTTLAYKAVPMFWTGTAMLLIGVVMVAAVPTLRQPRPVGAASAASGLATQDDADDQVEANLATAPAPEETTPEETTPEETASEDTAPEDTAEPEDTEPEDTEPEDTAREDTSVHEPDSEPEDTSAQEPEGKSPHEPNTEPKAESPHEPDAQPEGYDDQGKPDEKSEGETGGDPGER
ncbi:hypothetical protein BU204_19890 [Actinophytocola xanthii]|uniref:Uncharacterized protein n=1 Tax=Actinophytocola xanthii TaxID=1912961 RepID=A0A1Q8CNC0_9PSEU|nr:hypothetical protein BU204_19890 [Actinophytocola xanthii]